ncbi:uncharacterized protein LOC128200426 [Galleria mellonella]|uniref:Uncharacterized protein LOC128200426 n=1 Tax=Galleria mellonella TaxID=7137 RepID=A0ABM3MEE1_GALME|nr:uncharacterized protein LOC128200426 [Galleria mellonella]
MATNESLSYDNGDINRISRDYAVMRLEIMEQSDLLGFSEVDFKDLANEFHIAQYKKCASNLNNNNSEPQTSVKLPKISIKPFDSTIDNWISFIQLFDSLVHNRTNISNVEKLHYLLSSVQENLAILEKYKLPDKNFMLFHLLWSKLDKVTKEAFQLDQNTEDIQDSIPKFEHLQKFIEKHYKALQLPITKTQQSISGIGHSTAQPLGSSFCEIKPINSSSPCNFNLKALVLSSICAHQPSQYINSADWSHINKLSLADSDFDRPGPIDMLLSAGVFASALLPGLRKGKVGQPRALRTVFGWIIMDNNIKRFWEIENVTSSSKLSKEDQICEQYFVKNSHRNHEGRFIVPLPFIDPNNKPIFSNSREIAMRRFLSLENKLKNNFEFRQLYTSFMEDYETCGHLKEVNVPISSVGEFYYIPHHGILRPESVTTPLRVVFDASAKDANNLSLNDTLLPGPKLQLNITDLLLRFRWHSVVFTGDIKQMYRQIMVSDKDSEYQRILWRSSPDEPIRDYKLLTVTYGVSSAPYQALRTIAQVAENSATEFPSGSAVLSRDIYVDDVVSGAESVEKALSIRSELTKMLSSNGFHLRKWTSNHKDFLNNIKPSDLYSEEFRSFEEASDVTLKILGLLWIPSVDCFTFKVAEFEERRLTKRTILSDIARIYDPLGFLGPVTFYAKYLMQLLWTSGVSWDSDIPEDIAREWSKFKSQLSSLSSISITRRMVNSFVSLQFHGFCDASERGYCAVVYCRSVDANGCCSVEFCCAKTKVAPLRKLSLPRLELQAAVLLADLINSVLSALKPLHDINNIFAWSDSTVALSWIKSCPSKWQTFVANRVSHIQDIVSPECWHHVSTNFNPADGGSRGMHPADLVKHKCWWKGPVWLSEPEENWPESLLILPSSHDVQAEQKILCLQTSSNVNFVDQLLNKFSLLITLKRVLSFCFRFIHNSRRSSSNEKNVGPLLSSETNKSFMYLIKYVQQTTFSKEIDNLKRNRSNLLPKSLRKLSLFLDVAGLLRVGGRLANANVNYNVKHPLLLPRDHRLTHLIIDDCHKKFMHPGAQTLQNILAQNFWILSPKRAIRSVIAGCMKCFRAKPQPAPAPLMGNLPAYRINQIKPFSNVVVDYGGPFDIALGRGRGVKTYKGYICVFVCTATKAIHLELASELTTEAFLAALKRFIARRGRCSHIISDQGRNFVGASNYLASIMKEISESQEIKFSLSPPGSPHFNGLAEAGIKSIKAHLVRVIGLQRLTFEEFYTILTQIESMLNSRPLSPLSSDANDFSVLTPGHFLTLEPLSTIPEENITNQTISILQRWKLVKKIHQDFWLENKKDIAKNNLRISLQKDKCAVEIKSGFRSAEVCWSLISDEKERRSAVAGTVVTEVKK